MSIFEGLIKPTLDSTINQELTMIHVPVTFNIDIKEVNIHIHVESPADSEQETTDAEQTDNA